MSRPIQAKINLSAIRHNLTLVKKIISNHGCNTKSWSVIKADAYGHGLLRVANALSDLTDGFALLEIESAIKLRETGLNHPILLMEGIFDPSDLDLCIQYKLIPVIHCFEQLDLLKGLTNPESFPVYLKLNTGMNRLGFRNDQINRLKIRLSEQKNVVIKSLMTHFAEADSDRGIAWQLETLQHMKNTLEEIVGPQAISAANSAAILRYSEALFDTVRPGIMLYGGSPFSNISASELGLRPAMTLESEIIAIQDILPGEQVGYGGLFRARKTTRVGVVACGYADGSLRSASQKTPILVEGKETKLLGRVSMDLLACDLTNLPEAKVGSRVVLWGEGLPAEKVAASSGSICYELFAGLTKRVRIVETSDQNG